MTIPACVLACVNMGMHWETIALACRLDICEVEALVRAESVAVRAERTRKRR